jgi:hypothetical protein
MRSDHSTHNKIVPIKSLIESSRHSHKRHYLNFASKDSVNPSEDGVNTPKSQNRQYGER